MRVQGSDTRTRDEAGGGRHEPWSQPGWGARRAGV